MLMIRLQRVGRKHEPSFRLVLTDKRNSTKSGRFIEVLGSYDPRKKNEHFNGEAILSWIGKGAQLSLTAHNLLLSHGIIKGKKKNALPKKTAPKKEVPEEVNTTPSSEISSPEAQPETQVETPTE